MRTTAPPLAALLLTTLLGGPPAAGADFMGRPLAQTMSHQGAPWLTRDSRMREERPDLLWPWLDLAPGDAACDIGAGNGFHTLVMAQAIAPGGVAWAVDIQPEMLTLLDARATEAGVDNVRPVQGTQTETRLPPATCDVALLVDVYHEFSDPAAMLGSLRESLKPAGRLVLVEYRAEDPAVPIKALHKMTKAAAHRELTAHGFKLVGQLDALPWQHALAYQRDDGPDPAQEPTPWTPQTASPTPPMPTPPPR